MKVILIRHGESEHNVGLTENKNSFLTKKGKRQVEFLGRKLKKQKISNIYSSNLTRAKQTAEIISDILKVPIKKNIEELNEYSTSYLKYRLKNLFNLRLKKLKKFLKDISEDKEKNKTILIIAHGITNRIILGFFLQIPLEKQLLFFKQHNTGISILDWNSEYKNWRLEVMNDISHLPNSLI